MIAQGLKEPNMAHEGAPPWRLAHNPGAGACAARRFVLWQAAVCKPPSDSHHLLPPDKCQVPRQLRRSKCQRGMMGLRMLGKLVLGGELLSQSCRLCPSLAEAKSPARFVGQSVCKA